MSDWLTDLAVDRDSLELVASPERLHRHVTALLPDLHGRSTAIRADTETLFRVDLPTDRLGERGRIGIRFRGSSLPSGLTEITCTDSLGDGDAILVQVAAEQRLTMPDGIKTRPVADGEAASWATALFRRHGLETSELRVSSQRRFGHRRAVHFTVREIAATVYVADADAADRAFNRGIGRGRSYGLGMIVPLDKRNTKTFQRGTHV